MTHSKESVVTFVRDYQLKSVYERFTTNQINALADYFGFDRVTFRNELGEGAYNDELQYTSGAD